MLSREHKKLCELFAGILEYPDGSLAEMSAKCAQLLGDSFQDAADIQAFAEFVSSRTREEMEESYIQTFDMTTATTFYLGYHLFGESPKRNALMLKLDEAYHSTGIVTGGELPDHLCVALRFLGAADDPEFCQPLIDECILPALGKIEAILKRDKNVYRHVVSALMAFLRQVSRKMVRVGGLRV